MASEPQTITALAARLSTRTVSAMAVLEQCLDRIRERDRAVNAFITVLEESAKADALEADRETAERSSSYCRLGLEGEVLVLVRLLVLVLRWAVPARCRRDDGPGWRRCGFRFLQVAWAFHRTGELPRHDAGHVEGVETGHQRLVEVEEHGLQHVGSKSVVGLW